MAIELQGFKFTAIAGADLTNKQYRFMMMSGNMTVTPTTSLGVIPCGVLQNNPPLGGAAEIMVYGITKVYSGVPLAIGTFISGGGNGDALVIDPDGTFGQFYAGQMVISTGNAGEIGSALINCATPIIQSGS